MPKQKLGVLQMNKRIIRIYLIFALVLVIVFSGVLLFLNSKSFLSDSKKLVFYDSDEYTKSLGYNTVCDAEYAFYRLKDEVLDEKINIIKRFEAMFKIAVQKYGMNFKPPVIYISNNEEDVKKDFLGYTININDPVSYGIIFDHASGGTLPVWICLGLESYWANDNGFQITANKTDPSEISALFTSLKNIPEFGDAWLISNFNENVNKNLLFDFSYSFIEHLDTVDQLTDYIKSAGNDYGYFIDKSKELINSYADDMWKSNLTVSMHYEYENEFSIKTKAAIYKYEEPCTWKWEDIVNRTEEMEACIRFVKEFIDFDYNGQLDITLSPNYNKYSYSADGTNKVTLYRSNDGGFEDCTHEVTHSLCKIAGIEKKTSGFFKEGLAQLTAHLFDEAYKTNKYTRIQKIVFDYYINMDKQLTDDYDIRHRNIYNNRMSLLLDDKKFDYDILVDCDAILEFEMDEKVAPLLYSSASDYILGNVLDDKMYTYIKAESFMVYLYNTYGKDKILTVYSDNDKIEEVYGKSLQQLVDEWKQYLGV